MNLLKIDFVQLDLAIVTASKYGLVGWVNRCRPYPIFHFTNSAKKHPLSVPERNFLITATHHEVVAFWEERD
jgi:hypothetical protein